MKDTQDMVNDSAKQVYEGIRELGIAYRQDSQDSEILVPPPWDELTMLQQAVWFESSKPMAQQLLTLNHIFARRVAAEAD